MRDQEFTAKLMEAAKPYERRALIDEAMKYQAAAMGAAAGQASKDRRVVR